MYSPTTTKDDNVQNLKNSTQNLKDNARDVAGDVKDTLTATANRAGHQVRHFIDTATDEITHASETVSTRIHDKPLQSSAIALGVGFVLGMLFRR